MVIATSPVIGASPDPNATAFVGVVLDWRPLSELVTKHLNLTPGKGRRIENIWSQSPADKAGLERDDILVAFQGQDVNDLLEFGQAVVKTGVGKLVFLDVIHAGQRKTVKLTLVARPKDLKPKYPPDFHAMDSTVFRGMWRQDPNSGQWVPFNALPDANGMPPLPFPQEVYTFTYDQTVFIIEGNPRADASTVIVKAGQTEFKSTVGQLDKLPASYYDQVKQALHQARRDSDRRRAMWQGQGRRGPDGRGGGQPGARMSPDERDGPPWADYTERMLGSLTRYLEGLDRSTSKPDMDRLKLLEDKLRQLQAKIDELQAQANKAKESK